MKHFLIRIIGFYRNYISGMKLQTCRFHPTCSQYALEAINRKGAMRGVLTSVKRILRCHPFSPGGYDPVNTD